MKATVYTEYGPPEVLQFKEVEKPTPKDDEVLVEIHASSVNYVDWHLLKGDLFLLRLTTGGFLKPRNKILGDDLAGRVEAVGRNVKQFQPGDELFGMSNGGAFAEYRCVDAGRGLCLCRRVLCSILPSAAPGTIDFHDGEQKNGCRAGATKPKGLDISNGAS